MTPSINPHQQFRSSKNSSDQSRSVSPNLITIISYLAIAMDGAKKSRNPHKAPADYRSDRKSASGMSGEPKKGGRGGKFTWEGADSYAYADDDLDLVSSKNSTNAKTAAADGNKKAQDGGDDE
uniref:Uncharacterized protein n=1 Tax=Leersia perrieri TaxID=77586 RepID=A0A0D9WDK6_9ORYZ